MSNDRWGDVEKKPDLLVSIMELVRSQDVTPGKVHTRRFAIAGIQLSCDRVWFVPAGIHQQHRLSGKDWNVVISLSAHKNRNGQQVKMGIRYWDVMGIDFKNRDNFERDLALLRMFDLEELLG